MEFMTPLPKDFEKSSKLTLENWQCLNRRLNSYVSLHRKGGPRGRPQKNSILSYLGGKEVIDMIKYLGRSNDDSDLAANILLKQISNICLPKFILLNERFKYFSRSQKQDECLCVFLADLIRMFEFCELRNYQLKDRVIGGVASESLRALLKTNCTTLKGMFEICQERGICKDGTCAVNFRSINEKVLEWTGTQQDAECLEDVTEDHFFNCVDQSLKSKLEMSSELTEECVSHDADRFTLMKRGEVRENHTAKVDKCGKSRYYVQESAQESMKANVSEHFGKIKENLVNVNSVRNAEFHVKCVNEDNHETDAEVKVSSTESQFMNTVYEKLFNSASSAREAKSAMWRKEVKTKVEPMVSLGNSLVDHCSNNSKDVKKNSCEQESNETNDKQSFERIKQIEEEHLKRKPTKKRENLKRKHEVKSKSVTKSADHCSETIHKIRTKYQLKMKLSKRQNKSIVTDTGKKVVKKNEDDCFLECHRCKKFYKNKSSFSKHLKLVHGINVLSFCISDGSKKQSNLLKSPSNAIKDEDTSQMYDPQKGHTLKEIEEIDKGLGLSGETFTNFTKTVKADAIENSDDIINLTSNNEVSCLVSEQSTNINMIKLHEKKKLLTEVALMLKEQKLGIRFPTKKVKEKKYIQECSVCAKQYSWPSELKRHFLLKHPDETMPKDLGGVCAFCGKVFKSSTTLHRHESVHGRQRFPCEICGVVLISKHWYEHHKKMRHELIVQPKRFVCEVCGKAFRSHCYLRAHSSKHSSVKPFKCDQCEMCFKQKKTLVLHLKVHAGEAPYKCETCGEGFIDKRPLENHLRKHSGEKPFICSTCGAGFRIKPALSAHMKMHDLYRPRPFKCSDCNYTCTKKSNLTKHNLRHTGEKPYQCSICEARFTTTYGRNKHLKRTHGVKDPSAAPAACVSGSEMSNKKIFKILTSSISPQLSVLSHSNLPPVLSLQPQQQQQQQQQHPVQYQPKVPLSTNIMEDNFQTSMGLMVTLPVAPSLIFDALDSQQDELNLTCRPAFSDQQVLTPVSIHSQHFTSIPLSYDPSTNVFHAAHGLSHYQL